MFLLRCFGLCFIKKRVEDIVLDQMKLALADSGAQAPVLNRTLHVEYVTKSLKEVGRGYAVSSWWTFAIF